MNQLAVMVDGEVILDKAFDSEKVDRTTISKGVREEGTVRLNEQEIDALRKVGKKKPTIRFTGDRGYVTVNKGPFSWGEDIGDLLSIYDQLQSALKDKQPKTCSA